MFGSMKILIITVLYFSLVYTCEAYAHSNNVSEGDNGHMVDEVYFHKEQIDNEHDDNEEENGNKENEDYMDENSEEEDYSHIENDKGDEEHEPKLQRPTHVKYSIVGDAVRVHWRHLDYGRTTVGYYIQVQETTGMKMNQGPLDFVHVSSKTRETKIRGFKPMSTYNLQVIASSEYESVSSLVVEIDTSGLEFLKARNLTVSAVKDRSATFTWYHNPKNNIHDIQFKLLCAGMHMYTEGERAIEEATTFQHVSWSTSNAQETVVANTLIPITKYVCHIRSVAGTQSSHIQDKVAFTTLQGNPSKPPQPKIVMSEEQTSFTLKLYQSNDYYGSVGHYTVYAMPVFKRDTEPMSAPFAPLVPYSQLVSKAVTSHLVASSSEPLPFVVAQYHSPEFPKELEFDGTLGVKELKPETHYSFVVIAFSAQSNTSSELKYSMSNPADPPVYIDQHLSTKWIAEKKPVVRHFLLTILVTCLVALGVMCILLTLLMGYELLRQRKMRNKESMESTDSGDDSLKFQVYRKKNIKKKLSHEELELLLPAPVRHSQNQGMVATDIHGSLEKKKWRNSKLKWIKGSRQRNQKKDPRRGFYSVTTPQSSPLPTSSEKSTPTAMPVEPQTKLESTPAQSPLVQPQRSHDPHTSPEEESSSLSLVYRHRLTAMSSTTSTGSFTLSHSKQYSPPKALLESQTYYKKHKPGSPRPRMKEPREPKKSSIITQQKNMRSDGLSGSTPGVESDHSVDAANCTLLNISIYASADEERESPYESPLPLPVSSCDSSRDPSLVFSSNASSDTFPVSTSPHGVSPTTTQADLDEVQAIVISRSLSEEEPAATDI